MFEKTADLIEKKLGLENQPRAIVFHEKDGRRHAHVVWSRIDSEKMRAINLPHYKTKLRDVSRSPSISNMAGICRAAFKIDGSVIRFELYAAGNGNKQSAQMSIRVRSRRRFKMHGSFPTIEASFEAALKERGFWLARGDRRGFVALLIVAVRSIRSRAMRG